jgi:two-component system LytT family sensor kinase
MSDFVIKRVWDNPVPRHAFFWIVAFAALYLSIRILGGHRIALIICTAVIVPGPIPVYAHLLAQRFFFEKKKYTHYVAAMVLIVALSGCLIEFVFTRIERDPGSHINGFAVAFVLIVITSGLKYYIQGLRERYLIQEAEFKQVKSELALLKSQIQPHFFFNTLNNLYALSLDKSDRVPEVIIALSELMRYILDSANKKEVPLAEEVKFIENYLGLEKLRFTESADIRFNVLGDTNGKKIAPMLFIPFVENSFKHGMMAPQQNGYVRVSLTIRPNELDFIVENSKGDFARGVEKDSHQLGLKNAKRTLELLYPKAHRLTILDEEHRYRVELKLWQRN